MYEAATLYYDKNLTQQEIARQMNLSRQTVSRLLCDALRENIVEIKIHNPEKNQEDLQSQICQAFGLQNCVVSCVASEDASIRLMMTVAEAVRYLLPILQKGGLKIGLSWGRTIQQLIRSLPETDTRDNTVFPLFGATDHETDYFSSNELARSLADKIGARLRCAWFPYRTDSSEDSDLIKHLSYYHKIQSLWSSADLMIMGIGNTQTLDNLEKTFGHSDKHSQVIGDVATHFFDQQGHLIHLYDNTLCASQAHIQGAKETIAIACGKEKAQAIAGALRTGMIKTLITDEYTAKEILTYI